MNRIATLSFVLLLGSAALAAQGQTAAPEAYVIPVPTGLDCPVSMHALQGSGGGILTTRQILRNGQSPTPAPITQRIHLILGNRKSSSKVAAAKVTVRGTSGKWRNVPAAMSQDVSPDATKNLDLTFQVAENGESSTDLVLPGFTSVQSISLVSLTYADGSVWSPSASKTCRVAPDPFMLVSRR